MPTRRTPAHLALALAVIVIGAGACNLQLSTDVEAKNTWNRTYPISADGRLVIKNSNGRIEVNAGDGADVQVSVERIVRAGNEEAANDQLAGFDIVETSSGNEITLDSSTRGMQFGVSRRANYIVSVPRGLAVTLESSNGDIAVTGVGGHFEASSSNGRIRAIDLQRSAKVSTTNGVIDVVMAGLAEPGVTAETTNGQVTVTLPPTVSADVSARVTNGGISHDGLDLQVLESSRRRFDARLNGGGIPVRIETTNGAVRLRGGSQ